MLVSTILQDRLVPDQTVLRPVLWGTELRGKRIQNRPFWRSTTLVTTLSPGTGWWTVSSLPNYYSPRPKSRTEPVLCGSVVGSVLSTRRFCGFCTPNICSPSAGYACERVRTRLGTCARGTAVPHHRTYRTAGLVTRAGCTAGKAHGRMGLHPTTRGES